MAELLKLTIKELEAIIRQAKYNDNYGDGNCLLLLNTETGIVSQGRNVNCDLGPLRIDVKATVCKL